MPDILTIQDCMALVMGDVREVAKRDVNQQQHFSFRGVDAVVNAVGPALRRHKVVVLPRLESKEYVPVATKSGTQMMCCRVTVTYLFVGPGGDRLEATVAGEAFDAGDKSTPKAMSVAFRTALLQALALPTDDIDPDSQTYDVGESTVAPPTGQGSVTSPRAGKDGAASDGSLSGDRPPATDASPTLSVVAGEQATDVPDPEQGTTGGEATVTSPSGSGPTYLTKDEQKELIQDYGSSKLVLEEFRKHFGTRLQRVADITCEMVEAMNERS